LTVRGRQTPRALIARTTELHRPRRCHSALFTNYAHNWGAIHRVRCARIIHGKGIRSSSAQPVLKQKVNYWLRLHDEVLAFCSATRGDGGTGAVYCLLRNPNKAKRQAGNSVPAGRP